MNELHAQTGTQFPTFATRDDIIRVEARLKDISDTLVQLVRIEERQTNQASRITALETELRLTKDAHSELKSKVDMWVSRGVGGWFVIVTLWAVIQFLSKR